MATPQVRLKLLLRDRHWQTIRTFSAEYDKAARQVDPALVGLGPSRAQLHRWTSGELKGLPYPDHCRVLEKMFPGWTAAQLFERVSEEAPSAPEEAPAVPAARVPEPDGDPWGTAIRGNIIELSMRMTIDIDADGGATLTDRQELLNLSDKPLTRIARELWFEHTRGPLKIAATPDADRRVMIQRIHDTANLAKFACQISPPLQSGESVVLGYTCEGARFVDDHYWRQDVQRFMREYTLRVRQRGARKLIRCAAFEEQTDGAENSADADLVWDFDGDDVVISLTREYLHPGQAVTLRWDVPHEQQPA